MTSIFVSIGNRFSGVQNRSSVSTDAQQLCWSWTDRQTTSNCTFGVSSGCRGKLQIVMGKELTVTTWKA